MKSQQGSTLVMVLIVLLLITLIGTMAMRESLLNLRLSTNAQVNNVLLNSSDSALFELEDSGKVRERIDNQSVYGYFDAAANAKDELTFCFDVRKSDFFHINRASVIGSSKRGNNGYCSLNTFSTGRDAVITQVYVRKLDLQTMQQESGSRLTGLTTGTDHGQRKFSNMKHVAVTTVSILPGLTKTVSAGQVETCFKKTSLATVTDNVEKCLQGLNMPYNMQYAEYSVGTEYK